jgi:hypothetical protein
LYLATASEFAKKIAASRFVSGHGFTGCGKSHMTPAEAGSGSRNKGLIGTTEVMP